MNSVSKIKSFLRFFLLFLTISLIADSAFSAENEMGMNACKADVEKFCKEVKPGDGRILQCLKENHEILSGECKQQMAKAKEKMQEKMKEIQESCKEDVEEYCKNVQPGEGRIMQCLKKNVDHLSNKCKESFQKHGQ